jgi:anti-sigma B factor antagonist
MTDEQIVNVSNVGDVYVVSINQASIGGAEGIERIRQILRPIVQDEQPRKVVIDFSAVCFFSSQMLGLLVDLWRRLKNAGGALLISGINPRLTRVFRITRLDKLFDFYEDTDAAVAALRVSQ